MMKLVALAILLTLFSASWANWTTPILVSKGIADRSPALYQDPTSGTRFAFYAQNTSSESFLCRSIYNPDDSLDSEECLNLNKWIRDITVTGSGNGQDLFLAFSAGRTITGGNCKENDVNGCIDVFYMESSDAGKTWTQPRAVPRANMKDAVMRTMPKILFMEESRRLFIFYYRVGEAGEICQVARPDGSSIFNNEAVVYHNDYPITRLQVTSTSAWGETNIHVVFVVLYWMAWIRSNNNGISWEGAEGIRYVKPDVLYSITPSYLRDTVFIASSDQRVFTLTTIDYDFIIEHMLEKFDNKQGYNAFVCMVPGANGQVVLTGNAQTQNVTTYMFDNGMHKLNDTKFTPPMNPYPDGGIRVEDTLFIVSVLHAVDNDLYLSSVALQKPVRNGNTE